MAKPSAAVLKAIGEAAIPVTKRIKYGPHRIGSVELHESRTKSDYDAILEAIGPNTKVSRDSNVDEIEFNSIITSSRW